MFYICHAFIYICAHTIIIIHVKHNGRQGHVGEWFVSFHTASMNILSTESDRLQLECHVWLSLDFFTSVTNKDITSAKCGWFPNRWYNTEETQLVQILNIVNQCWSLTYMSATCATSLYLSQPHQYYFEVDPCHKQRKSEQGSASRIWDLGTSGTVIVVAVAFSLNIMKTYSHPHKIYCGG